MKKIKKIYRTDFYFYNIGKIGYCLSWSPSLNKEFVRISYEAKKNNKYPGLKFNLIQIEDIWKKFSGFNLSEGLLMLNNLSCLSDEEFAYIKDYYLLKYLELYK